MGFNKRFVDKKTIESYFSNGMTLKDVFKADALIFMDSFASDVFELYTKGISDEEIKSKLLEINEGETKKTASV